MIDPERRENAFPDRVVERHLVDDLAELLPEQIGLVYGDICVPALGSGGEPQAVCPVGLEDSSHLGCSRPVGLVDDQ